MPNRTYFPANDMTRAAFVLPALFKTIVKNDLAADLSCVALRGRTRSDPPPYSAANAGRVLQHLPASGRPKRPLIASGAAELASALHAVTQPRTRHAVPLAGDLISSHALNALPVLHDTVLNPIAATCFETGVSLAILDSPGAVGDVLNDKARALHRVLASIYNDGKFSDLALGLAGQTYSWRQLFDSKMLKKVAPDGDEIGRCAAMELNESWMTGAKPSGWTWVESVLQRDGNVPGDGQWRNTLTQIWLLSSFGTLLYDLLTDADAGAQNRQFIARLMGMNEGAVQTLHDEMMRSLRHAAFDSPETRDRWERRPMVRDENGVDLTTGAKRVDGRTHNAGTGRVYAAPSFATQAGSTRHEAQVRAMGRMAMARVHEPIRQMGRPGVLTDDGYARMPEPFRARLIPALASHELTHGNAINRWIVMGSYGRQSRDAGMPVACAHSASAFETLYALTYLEGESLSGKRDMVEAAALGIASFMNFGGYHTFVEVLPLSFALADGETFSVNVKTNARQQLYGRVAAAVERLCPDIRETFSAYRNAMNIAEGREASGGGRSGGRDMEDRLGAAHGVPPGYRLAA